MNYPTNSSSFSITFKISFGNLLVASPTFGGEPNIASYGDLLMPSWKRQFWNWMNFNPTAYLVVSLSRIQLTIMSWMSAFDHSTLPCDCGYAEAYHEQLPSQATTLLWWFLLWILDHCQIAKYGGHQIPKIYSVKYYKLLQPFVLKTASIIQKSCGCKVGTDGRTDGRTPRSLYTPHFSKQGYNN